MQSRRGLFGWIGAAMVAPAAFVAAPTARDATVPIFRGNYNGVSIYEIDTLPTSTIRLVHREPVYGWPGVRL